MNPRVLYFGCLDTRGHSLHSHDIPNPRLDSTPWGVRIDTGLLITHGVIDDTDSGIIVAERLTKMISPSVEPVQWTAISFWDRSGDSRPNSNSAFLIPFALSPRDLLSLSKVEWPHVFTRHNFPVLKFFRMTEPIYPDTLTDTKSTSTPGTTPQSVTC